MLHNLGNSDHVVLNGITRNLVIFLFSISTFIIFESCEKHEIEPITEPSIAEFIASQNLPKSQPYKTSSEFEQEEVTLFTVKFGEPFDCISGCAYNRAVGLKYKDKIGWLSIDNYNDVVLPEVQYFNVAVSDTFLFSESFWNALKKNDEMIYQYSFLYILAADIDTPKDALTRIASGMYSFIDAHLGDILLSNINVKNDKSILTILANLPVFNGDAYANVRSKARQMLEGK